ncbi:MAG: hypothetical protein HQL30_12570 [Candidatus Omnitrophica bacterium]|nr:hypothetical protein [Candidatus Omnitrophota bacterium]
MWECAECGYKYNDNDKSDSCWACKAHRQVKEKSGKPMAASPVEGMPVKPAKHKSSTGLIAVTIAGSVLFTVIICFIAFNFLYREKEIMNDEKTVQIIKEPLNQPAPPQPVMKEKSVPPAPDNVTKPPTRQPARLSEAEIQDKANAALRRQTGMPLTTSGSKSGAARGSISDQEIARKAEASLARNLAQTGQAR